MTKEQSLLLTGLIYTELSTVIKEGYCLNDKEFEMYLIRKTKKVVDDVLDIFKIKR